MNPQSVTVLLSAVSSPERRHCVRHVVEAIVLHVVVGEVADVSDGTANETLFRRGSDEDRQTRRLHRNGVELEVRLSAWTVTDPR
jgi:hypothetical protein